MKTMVLILFLSIVVKIGHTQQDGLKNRLYELEDNIIAGDKESLKEMAAYLDDTTGVTEFLG